MNESTRGVAASRVLGAALVLGASLGMAAFLAAHVAEAAGDQATTPQKQADKKPPPRPTLTDATKLTFQGLKVQPNGSDPATVQNNVKTGASVKPPGHKPVD